MSQTDKDKKPKPVLTQEQVKELQDKKDKQVATQQTIKK